MKQKYRKFTKEYLEELKEQDYHYSHLPVKTRIAKKSIWKARWKYDAKASYLYRRKVKRNEI